MGTDPVNLFPLFSFIHWSKSYHVTPLIALELKEGDDEEEEEEEEKPFPEATASYGI